MSVLRNLYRYLTGQDRAMDRVQWWVADYGLELAALEPCKRPPFYNVQLFPEGIDVKPSGFRYFRITVIDPNHVRHSGIARALRRTGVISDLDQVVQVVWLRSEQLNWRTQPPRRAAGWPDDHAQGWCIDPTRTHELRWYSAGMPTDLVKDGLTESRDPPAGLVLSGEPLPCRLFGYAEHLPYPGPADAPAAQEVDVVVDGGVGLGHHRLDLGQAGEQLVIWPLIPRAELGRRLLGDDQVAQAHAFVADVDTRAGDQLGDGVLVLVAERAAQDACPGFARGGGSGIRLVIRHAVRLALTAWCVKATLTTPIESRARGACAPARSPGSGCHGRARDGLRVSWLGLA